MSLTESWPEMHVAHRTSTGDVYRFQNHGRRGMSLRESASEMSIAASIRAGVQRAISRSSEDSSQDSSQGRVEVELRSSESGEDSDSSQEQGFQLSKN